MPFIIYLILETLSIKMNQIDYFLTGVQES